MPKILYTQKSLENGSANREIHEWFRDDQSVELEIGSNNGLFLCGRGARSLQTMLIGIEIDSNLCNEALSAVNSKGLSNVRIVNAEGFRFIEEFVPDQSVDVIHIYFPTPDPSVIDQSLPPLLNDKFVKQAHRVIRRGGCLRMLTDHKPYYQMSEDKFDDNSWHAVQWSQVDAGQPDGWVVGTSCEHKFLRDRPNAKLFCLQVVRL